MHETTLDRDVRLSPDDIRVMQGAIRYRMKQVQRSIATAEANKRAGGTVQHGTLDRHYDERGDLQRSWEKLEAARVAIVRRLADVIEHGETRSEELGRMRRELSEHDHETPEHRDILDRIAVLVREEAEARRRG